MTSKMNRSEFNEVIDAPKERVWDVLFNQYGDIHIHNPTMVTSNYLHHGTKGELNAVRHCTFSDKLFLDEKITEVKGTDSFKIVVVAHNLPFVKDMSAVYKVMAVGDEKTELTMISFNSFSPDFMKYLMRGQMAKSLLKHLFSLKYFVETGKVVTKDDYAQVRKNFA
jgi:hypothetical protein